MHKTNINKLAAIPWLFTHQLSIITLNDYALSVITATDHTSIILFYNNWLYNDSQCDNFLHVYHLLCTVSKCYTLLPCTPDVHSDHQLPTMGTGWSTVITDDEHGNCLGARLLPYHTVALCPLIQPLDFMCTAWLTWIAHCHTPHSLGTSQQLFCIDWQNTVITGSTQETHYISSDTLTPGAQISFTATVVHWLAKDSHHRFNRRNRVHQITTPTRVHLLVL